MSFPRHVHQPEGRYVVVHDDETLSALLDRGWLAEPPAHVEQPVEVRLPEALNGAVIDFDATEPIEDAPDVDVTLEKKKPGRKPKAY